MLRNFAEKSVGMDYREKEQKITHCLQCGEAITYGRSDRKFCCEECKNRFHNRQTNAARAVRARVNGILDRNYRLLEHWLGEGRDEVDVMEAVEEGFNLDFATTFHKSRSRMELACYDIHYRQSENRISAIHKIRNVSVNLHPERKEK